MRSDRRTGERFHRFSQQRHFKMIRYCGFLSNRRRGEMLPKVYDALEMESKDAPALPCYVSMLKKLVNVDPYECLLCKEGLEI